MLTTLIDWTVKENINLSLPSLRVDNFSDELVEQLNKVRRSGLTFAPEAGTQRLRDVINKNVTQEEVIRTCTKAFDNGWTSVKLLFYDGLTNRNNGRYRGYCKSRYGRYSCFL